MREIRPSDLRSVTLKRRLRGYDRAKTEELLAEVAESYETVRRERDALSEEMADLRREQEEREVRFRAEVDTLRGQLSARDRRIIELESDIARYDEERSGRLNELSRLREELADARTALARLQEELFDQRERAARLDTRQKAMGEQIAMMASQLEVEEATRLPPPRPASRALPESAGRAASMLVRFDHAVKMLERETRQQAELTLKKARERADEIVESAEAQRRRLDVEIGDSAPRDEPDREEYDPVAALERIRRRLRAQEAPDPLESRIGEASWTSRPASRETADRDTVQ